VIGHGRGHRKPLRFRRHAKERSDHAHDRNHRAQFERARVTRSSSSPRAAALGQVPASTVRVYTHRSVECVDSDQWPIYRKNVAPAKLPTVKSAAWRCLVNLAKTGGGRTVRTGRDEMGSSVEGLKLRRMRVRNELSFNRNTEGEPERAEDLEALREELHRLNKQIEEAEH
jgi:hypothetical protein